MTIAEKIYKLRTDAGLSQEKFASKAGLSQSAVNYWESGKRQPRINQLKKIANAFDIPLYTLTDDNYPLWDINSELEKKRSRALGDTEMLEPPGPFTVPLSQYNNGNNIYKNLHEIAMQKELNREASTPVRSRKRANSEGTDYDPLSYENSYSFASSEEDFNNIQDEKQRELERHRAKPFKLHETDDPLKPFTQPLHSSYDESDDSHNDNSLKLHTNTRGIDWEQLDDFRFDELMLKLDQGEKLTPEEIKFKSAYLERCLKKIGNIFAKFYSMLNVEGQKKADEQIDRALEQVELLTKIPEYQKKPDTPQE